MTRLATSSNANDCSEHRWARREIKMPKEKLEEFGGEITDELGAPA